MNTEPKKKVMVVGGGIAGLTAAWELSRMNLDVHIVEKTCFLGGHAIKLCCKATEECQQCGACSVEKMLKNVVNEPEINIHLSTEIESINRNGNFKVSLNKGPEYIDPGLCTNCGACFEKCPEPGAIIQGFSKNNSSLYGIVEEKIPLIKDFCKDICPEGAISLDKKGTSESLDVDAVIIATGFQPFDPDIKGTYGYNKLDNVISGMDLEECLRQNGCALRPSDGKKPEKVAFIQCVGSRDERLGNLWCSQVCCPYALRMAEVIKNQDPETQISVFYMDIQNTGNNFPVFYEKCKSDIEFVRNIPVDIFPVENDKFQMRYLNDDEGCAVTGEFDLVVLSIGITPGEDNNKLSKIFDVVLDKDGFISNDNKLNKSSTSNKGIFVAGTAGGPKDIADSMANAGQAVCEATNYLGMEGKNDI
mgnify:CR=1 FL=1